MVSSYSESNASVPTATRPKSPPLAFEPTSNDSLAPLIFPPHAEFDIASPASTSPSRSVMGLTSPEAPGSEQDLQLIVDQQANAIHLLHEAFAAERQVWCLEKERLYQRIASLEHLLRRRDHHSPAKSPVMSPVYACSITSPQSRAMSSAQRLPSITEDENVDSLSRRRNGAPQAIGLSNRPPVPAITQERSDKPPRNGSVSFDGDVKIDDVPVSPPPTARGLSPPPLNNLAMAGHTPLRAARRPTPPLLSMAMDGIDDTPTRNNTHINAYLTRSNDEDEDVALKGPLNMPELPTRPDETNFTLEALSKRLEQIEQHPEEGRPLVFAERSPGLASPAELANEASPRTVENSTQGPPALRSVRDGHHSQSDMSSNALSPFATTSPNNGAPLSQQESHEAKMHHKFENGGIKLKRKPSTNFGAPFGQLSGFGPRRMT